MGFDFHYFLSYSLARRDLSFKERVAICIYPATGLQSRPPLVRDGHIYIYLGIVIRVMLIVAILSSDRTIVGL